MRFSHLLVSLCALTSLGGCAYIIPPESSTPRHNSVLGGPRRPLLNLVSGPLSALPPQQANAAATVVSALIEPVGVTAQAVSTAPVLPAVDPAVKAQAERELLATAPRALPPENQQFQVVGNYPALDSVPPRPALSGADSAQSRLSDTQAELERTRAEATQRKDALARDAAAEPSLLTPQTPLTAPVIQGIAPNQAPASLPAVTIPLEPRRAPISGGANLAPAALHIGEVAASPAPRITLPAAPPQPYAASLPAVPTFAPPAPLRVASLAPAQPQPVRLTPVQQPAAQAAYPTALPLIPAPVIAAPKGQMQPITLRPPVDYEATPVNTQLTPGIATVPFGGITVQPGDFNPLTGEHHSSLSAPANASVIRHSVNTNGTLAEYASSEAITPSRYAITPK